MLHRIWLGFFVVAFAAGLYQWLGQGDAEVFQRMVSALFDMASLSVELAIGLIGLMALWLGIMALGEASGLVSKLGLLLKWFRESQEARMVAGAVFFVLFGFLFFRFTGGTGMSVFVVLAAALGFLFYVSPG